MEDGVITNRKARFEYEILETFDAGIELFGHEVKALKFGHGDLTATHVIVRGGEAYVVNMKIPPYQPNNVPKDYEPTRVRRLLLTRAQIDEIEDRLHTAGLTAIPLRVYIKNRLVKMEIGIGKGKNKADKREAIKKREWSRLRRDIETR